MALGEQQQPPVYDSTLRNVHVRTSFVFILYVFLPFFFGLAYSFVLMCACVHLLDNDVDGNLYILSTRKRLNFLSGDGRRV